MWRFVHTIEEVEDGFISKDKNGMWVNQDHVCQIRKSPDDLTIIRFSDGQEVKIAEHYEELLIEWDILRDPQCL